MADVKWIKIVTDIFDDEKILLIETMPDSNAIIVCWFKLLCLAGKQNNRGVFILNDRIAYTEEMLAAIFRMPVNAVRLSLSTFENFGMIERIDGVITIPNWEKHQNIDSMDKIREQTRKRVASHREHQKKLAECNVTGNVTCNVTVTQCNATEEDKEKDKDKKEPTPYGVGKKDDAAAAAAPAPAKHAYGEYGWVKLEDEQYVKLLNDLGEPELSRCIRYIDESAQQNGNKNKWKDWNLVVRKCHREGWGLTKHGAAANQSGYDASGLGELPY